jgi:hypothetical protein
MYPTITINDGSTTTTLCHGVGERAASEWRLEGAIESSCDFARQTVEAIRAAWWAPVARTTRRPRVSFRVSQLYASIEAAHEARLTLAATVPATGTLYVNLSATRRVTHSSAALASCTATQNGLLVTASYTYECGAVAAEDYSS